MKREHTLALVLGALLLLFVVRGLVVKPQGQFEPRTEQRAVDLSGPFYAVYFAAPKGEQLIPEFRLGAGTIEQRLAALLEGPRSADLSRTLPNGVQVLDYGQLGNLLIVNFSHHLVTNHPGGSNGEILTVYSIVNTLVGVAGIERVQILVEHKSIDTLAGHLNLREPLRKDYTVFHSFVI